MNPMSKGKKVLFAFIAVIAMLIGLSVITDKPPVVKINDRLYVVFTKELNLLYENISNKDVKALKCMRWVKRLNITWGKLTDISFLNQMKNIENLGVYSYPSYSSYYDNRIKDLTPIQNCKKLKRFSGYRLYVSDLSMFKELINLKILEIDYMISETYDGCKINDISDVRYLLNLEYFSVEGENISDVSALRHCTKLRNLYLRGVTTTDGSALLELPNLESLEIDKGVLSENEIKTLEEKGVSVYEYKQPEAQ